MTAKVDAILVANDIRPDEEHLEQHGVKGMKWALSGGDPWRPTAHTFAFTKA